jgi:hypothetical protein
MRKFVKILRLNDTFNDRIRKNRTAASNKKNYD